jgi:hypothetical protein
MSCVVDPSLMLAATMGRTVAPACRPIVEPHVHGVTDCHHPGREWSALLKAVDDRRDLMLSIQPVLREVVRRGPGAPDITHAYVPRSGVGHIPTDRFSGGPPQVTPLGVRPPNPMLRI